MKPAELEARLRVAEEATAIQKRAVEILRDLVKRQGEDIDQLRAEVAKLKAGQKKGAS